MKGFCAGAAFVAAMTLAGTALAGDVCAYKVTKAIGFFCPARSGATLCLPQWPGVGNCDRTMWCYGGKSSFCSLEVEPVSGPLARCPYQSKRLHDWYRCVAKRMPTPAVATATAVFTATAIRTNTPIVTSTPVTTTTPVVTPTAVPTGTAAFLFRFGWR